VRASPKKEEGNSQKYLLDPKLVLLDLQKEKKKGRDKKMLGVGGTISTCKKGLRSVE